MKILITGGAGYIGSELVGFFLAKGHRVVVVDNLKYEPTSLLKYIPHENFEFKKFDVKKYNGRMRYYYPSCVFGRFSTL